MMILQIHRDTVKPERAAEYNAIEHDAARACRELKAPHPHVALEAIAAPAAGGPHAPALKEVWWLNEFASNVEMQRVNDAYANNGPLMAALGDVSRRRRNVIAAEVDVFARDRADLSTGAPWRIAGARVFVVVVTDRDAPIDGAVFETKEGTRYIFTAARTREAADSIAGKRPGAAIFAVRPDLGHPAQEWIDADPAFWKP